MFVIRPDDPATLQGHRIPAPNPSTVMHGLGGKSGQAIHRSSSILTDVSNRLARFAALPSNNVSKLNGQGKNVVGQQSFAGFAKPMEVQNVKRSNQNDANRSLAVMKPLPKVQTGHKVKKKKRTGKKVPVVRGYVPNLSPLVENALGELTTPARDKLLRDLHESKGESLVGRLDFEEPEQLVVTAMAQVGQEVVIAKKFASDHTFKRFLGRTGTDLTDTVYLVGCMGPRELQDEI